MSEQHDRSEVVALLREQLRLTAESHRARSTDVRRAAPRHRFLEWQTARLRTTYSDLAAMPRYRLAVDFFLEELYGAADFSKRDADLERVAPVMVRMLPAGVLHLVAMAVELNLMSQELDATLMLQLERDGCDITALDIECYRRSYQRCGNYESRNRQIELMRTLGIELDGVVRKPFIYTALRVMRGPAELAGFGKLQSFLEQGFRAFRRMKGADTFIDIVATRERRILDRIYQDHPSPFDLELP